MAIKKGEHKVIIYMVEDDKGHASLIEKNLRRAGISNEIVHFDNGKKALDHFMSDKFGNAEGTLILLDLNLPEVDGYEILSNLKGNDYTKSVPVIVLTTTDNPREIERCYELGCNVYITKPVEYESFSEAIRKLGLLFSIVKLPAVN